MSPVDRECAEAGLSERNSGIHRRLEKCKGNLPDQEHAENLGING